MGINKNFGVDPILEIDENNIENNDESFINDNTSLLKDMKEKSYFDNEGSISGNFLQQFNKEIEVYKEEEESMELYLLNLMRKNFLYVKNSKDNSVANEKLNKTAVYAYKTKRVAKFSSNITNLNTSNNLNYNNDINCGLNISNNPNYRDSLNIDCNEIYTKNTINIKPKKYNKNSINSNYLAFKEGNNNLSYVNNKYIFNNCNNNNNNNYNNNSGINASCANNININGNNDNNNNKNKYSVLNTKSYNVNSNYSIIYNNSNINNNYSNSNLNTTFVNNSSNNNLNGNTILLADNNSLLNNNKDLAYLNINAPNTNNENRANISNNNLNNINCLENSYLKENSNKDFSLYNTSLNLINNLKSFKSSTINLSNNIINSNKINKKQTNFVNTTNSSNCNKKGRKKTLLEGVKTELLDKAILREFRSYIKKTNALKSLNDYQKSEESEFWNEFMNINIPPFIYTINGRKQEFKSYNKSLMRYIFSHNSIKMLYSNFIKGREKEVALNIISKRSNSYFQNNLDNKKLYMYYSIYCKNLHKIYGCSNDQSFDFEEYDNYLHNNNNSSSNNTNVNNHLLFTKSISNNNINTNNNNTVTSSISNTNYGSCNHVTNYINNLNINLVNSSSSISTTYCNYSTNNSNSYNLFNNSLGKIKNKKFSGKNIFTTFKIENVNKG